MKRIEAREYLESLVGAGWIWSAPRGIDRVLHHPDDCEIYVWYHPFNHSLRLSPKLLDRVNEDMLRA